MKNFLKNAWRLAKGIRGIGEVIPVLMTLATRHDRERVQFDWSYSWTYNLFRLYEVIFWRRYGVKAEMGSVLNQDGSTDFHFYSKEAAVVFAEDWFRRFLKSKASFPTKIWFPRMRFDWLNDLAIALSPIPAMVGVPQGMCGGPRTSPHLLFAIAFDDSTAQGVVGQTVHTVSHTVTGSNPYLVTYAWQSGATDKFSSLTYAASAYATLIYNSLNYDSTHRAFFGNKMAPATGTNDIVLTLTGSNNLSMVNASYSGCKQTGQPDSSNFDAGGAGSNNYTQSTTVVASNCWLIGASTGRDAACTGITSGALRETANPNLFDSNGTVGTGSQGLSVTGCGDRVESKAMASFAPAVASGPANLKTYNTNPAANIKTIDTNAIANVKTLDTNA